MKKRKGFVSNSSSSSFIIFAAGGEILFEDGDTDMECCGSFEVPIDEVIAKLVKAKESGATTVNISHGGGYEG